MIMIPTLTLILRTTAPASNDQKTFLIDILKTFLQNDFYNFITLCQSSLLSLLACHQIQDAFLGPPGVLCVVGLGDLVQTFGF